MYVQLTTSTRFQIPPCHRRVRPEARHRYPTCRRSDGDRGEGDQPERWTEAASQRGKGGVLTQGCYYSGESVVHSNSEGPVYCLLCNDGSKGRSNSVLLPGFRMTLCLPWMSTSAAIFSARLSSSFSSTTSRRWSWSLINSSTSTGPIW